MLVLAIFFAWNNQISRFDKDFRSPYDEHTHFDYWWRIYEQKSIPEVYDRIHHESIKVWTCRGKDGSKDPICFSSGSGPTPHENSASNYLPTFYLMTAMLSSVLDNFVETGDLFYLAKLSNMGWGLICIALIAWLGLALKIPAIVVAVLVFGIGQMPAFVFASITFNQEMFVLLLCLVGVLWYVLRTVGASAPKFAVETGILAAICLSVKPTALLLPVLIVVAEIFNLSRPVRERLVRIISFSFVVLVLYIGATLIVNDWRGVNASDGLMRDFLLRTQQGDPGVLDWAGHVWTSFARSTASLHWRSLVDWDLPWLFLRFYPFVMLALFFSGLYLVFVLFKRKNLIVSVRLFWGTIVACILLPVSLAVFLLFDDFPFFFQPRYFTAYITLAVIFSTAFFTDMLRMAMARVCSSGLLNIKN